MAEIGLQANVRKSQDGQELVDEGIADGRINVGGDEHVLDGLQELHREEEEDARGQLRVGSSGVDPVRAEQAEGCKSSGHFLREAHFDDSMRFDAIEEIPAKKLLLCGRGVRGTLISPF